MEGGWGGSQGGKGTSFRLRGIKRGCPQQRARGEKGKGTRRCGCCGKKRRHGRCVGRVHGSFRYPLSDDREKKKKGGSVTSTQGVKKGGKRSARFRGPKRGILEDRYSRRKTGPAARGWGKRKKRKKEPVPQVEGEKKGGETNHERV